MMSIKNVVPSGTEFFYRSLTPQNSEMIRYFPLPSTIPMFHVVLYQPEIPDNTGAIGRTCVAVGARLHLVKPLGFQLEHRRLARAGMDYWNHLDYQIADDWNHLVAGLSGNYWYFTKKTVQSYTNVRYSANDVLVFGSESQGLPAFILDANPKHCVRIPMLSEARSLNLSVSVGVALYEAQRQLHSEMKKQNNTEM
ncbi:MAG: tRNA (cytidine(34)-2'-O)-methyltransferase [Planctomycetaceae bacterium]|jgi:tRNA (cytidine/uridine-2'-O-)-methyltransferase|nr:tRNA (cytidine(34)-2'-O)-methyltransferase [Planctomycetaceae bacterium]